MQKSNQNKQQKHLVQREKKILIKAMFLQKREMIKEISNENEEMKSIQDNAIKIRGSLKMKKKDKHLR